MFKKRVSIVVLVVFWIAGIASAKTSAIDAKYKAVGESALGKPSGKERASAGGRVRLYANGGIYWSSAGGTHAVYGPPFEKYKSLGAEQGKLGFPVTDVLTTADGGTQTLFRHGYILGDKSGAVTAEVMAKATFTAGSVTVSGSENPSMKSPTEALLLPQSGPTQTVTCNCSQGVRLEFGMCAITPAGMSSIRCQRGTCSNSCVITIVKQAPQ